MSDAAEDPFEEWVEQAIESLPPELASRVENLQVEIADEDVRHPSRLGFYQGVPLTRRSSGYALVLPDRITIYRRPIERVYGHDHARLRAGVKHVVLHEFAHHFGISDARLREIGKY